MRRWILSLACGASALAVGEGALAAPPLGEPYGGIFSARTVLRVEGDERPKDAQQAQESRMESPKHRWLLGGFVRDTERRSFAGGGGTYANSQSTRHPFQLSLNYLNLSQDGGVSTDAVDLGAKLVLWNPVSANLPVVSGVVRFFDPDDLGRRFDARLAVDQRLAPDVFATLNLGWGDSTLFGSDRSGFVSGIGATWSPRALKRLSVAADYLLKSNLESRDFWTLSATYAIGQAAGIRVGGGAQGTVFGQIYLKYDR